MAAAAALGVLPGCALLQSAHLPRSGPSVQAMQEQASVAVVPLTLQEAQHLAAGGQAWGLDGLPAAQPFDERVAVGDRLEIVLLEASPAYLLGAAGVDAPAASGHRSLVVPPQVVGQDGAVHVPFVGRVQVLQRKSSEIQEEIVQRLQGKANRPQAVVRLVDSSSQEVAVVGEVRQPRRIALGARPLLLLDAIAAAAGSSAPIEKTVVAVTRRGVTKRVPLQQVLQDPSQNIVLAAGDAIALYHRPQQFVALGAVASPGEVPFEAAGITLAQALARVGGLQDGRAAAHGVYLARADNDSVRIWRLDLSGPEGFLAMRKVLMRDGDVLYVANANAADLQKFLNLVGSALAPAANLNSLMR